MVCDDACADFGATRSVYVLVSELRPLLAQNNILIQYRAPKRADPDQPNALSLTNINEDLIPQPKSECHQSKSEFHPNQSLSFALIKV